MERKQTQSELKEMADQILAVAGLRWDGRPLDSGDFEQRSFEYRMQTGAYSRSGESRRRK